MSRLSPLVVLLTGCVLGLAGCGGDEQDAAAGSGAVSDHSGAGGSDVPVLSSSDADFVDAVPGWSLVQTFDEDGERVGLFANEDDSAVTVNAGIDTAYTLDSLPAGLALTDTRTVEGLTCGTSSVWDLGCYAPLDDGYFRITVAYDSASAGVELSAEELAAVGRLVLASFTAEAAETVGDQTCQPLTAEQTSDVLAPFLAGGALSVDEEYSYQSETDGDRCSFLLPEGAFAEGDGSTTYEGSDGYYGGLEYTRHRYDAGYVSTSGVYDSECDTGGTSQSEVFTSAASCIAEMNEAQGSSTTPSVLPEGSGGIVTDGQASFVVAPEGEYWYEGGIGGVSGDASFDEGLIALADALRSAG